ncbi:ribonuclease HII [Gleimia hominis]|uniref:ribonuclease HII n=1 Tax=Gleimia hominis TaxID=595468 RepID=UPI000C81086A|nr:ribonuclease HII [Gleimia hominis]WIK65313.1 ribonuclease HII [Gleimia hominis]
MRFATPDFERSLMQPGAVVVGMDEVGRGSIAGPVAVGAATAGTGVPPTGLADSKLLSPRRRAEVFAAAAQWSRPCAVGFASAAEVDAVGISGALQLAGLRALEVIVRAVPAVSTVLLDGSVDWLTPRADLFADEDLPCRFARVGDPRVVTRIKADQECTVVAAASIVAKVARDHLMEALPDPGYSWASNKGYGSSAHRGAVASFGPSPLHRLSWKLG